MTKDEHALRQTVIDKRPNPTDVDAWPDISTLPGRLLPVLDLLRADLDAARIRGLPTDRLRLFEEVVYETREALIRLVQISPLEAWRLLHPPKLDPLDGVHDCRHPECPETGFPDADEKIRHYRRWGISP